MALQTQAGPSAPPMPMAESSLYRQRLEVIAEKRRLQEEIRAARLELEEEKLRVERLKRQSLRERWLMDGAEEVQDRPKDPASQDPESPAGQAQARIQNLEGSLFTLQAQLQLLQTASTGAQHKPLSKASWRRQGHRPLSQPALEAGPAGPTDVDKRASLPLGPAGMSPESPTKPSEEAAEVLPASRQAPEVTGASLEANGPCPGPSPPPEGAAMAERGVDKAKGGRVVQVVWEGLRAAEDCAAGPSAPELEAKVEEAVLEAIGDRQATGSPELPSWVKEDREVVQVVWEGVGGTEGSSAERTGAGGSGQEATQPSLPRLPEELPGTAAREGEGTCRGSPEGNGQGGSGGEEGSFIWVEKVALSEEWEELVVEGLEGPAAREAGDGGLTGPEKEGGEETWEVERKRVEESQGVEGPGAERERTGEAPGAEKEGDEGGLEAERSSTEGPLKTENGGGEKLPGPESTEETRGGDMDDAGGPPGVGESGEGKLGVEEKEVGEAPGEEKAGGEIQPQAAERAVAGPGEGERKGGEAAPEEEGTGGAEPVAAEKTEEPLEAEKAQGAEEALSPEGQSESGGARAPQTEEAGEAGASHEVKEELQPEEKQEGSPGEEAAESQSAAQEQGPTEAVAPPKAEATTSEQPSECQPLLPAEGPSANPTAHPAPTYAPARQPEPPAPTEGEEAAGPKQKTCQCCAVM